MKRCLSWPVFYELSEIYTAPLNIIWFIFGSAIAYQQFHMVSVINVLLCLVDVFLFDLAVNVADNYFDYIHGKDPNFLKHTNPVGRLKLPLTDVRNLVIIMYIVSALPGLVLVYRTGWQVLVMGIIGYIIGIFYTAGPKPLNATPLCEAIVAFFISFFIILVSVYVTIYGVYDLNWSLALTTLVRCLPLTFIFYALQLANNTCDLKEDIVNGRRTLASYIGFDKSLKLIKILIIIGMLFPLVVVSLGLASWPLIFTSLCLPLLWKPIDKFIKKPDKQTTFLNLVKNTSLFFIIYIFVYVLLVVL